MSNENGPPQGAKHAFENITTQLDNTTIKGGRIQSVMC